MKVAVMGAGLAGSCIALSLAKKGIAVDLIDLEASAVQGASLQNEGKLHLGYVYAADATKKTAQLLAKASASFIQDLSRLVDCALSDCTYSRPFNYVVPVDSQLDLREVKAHFNVVDDLLSNTHYKKSYEIPVDCNMYNKNYVQGVIATQEISLNTRKVSDIVNSAISQSGYITKCYNSEIESVKIYDGKYSVKVRKSEKVDVKSYDAVFNCLWGNRLKFDDMVNIKPHRKWIMRYKVAIWINNVEQNLVEDIPSTTFITGPYGDIVNHGDGSFYLSWYPTCKLSESTDLGDGPLLEKAKKGLNDNLFDNVISGLERLIPCVEKLRQYKHSATVMGGTIFAWGSTDITDHTSELHQRSDIGMIENKNWFSIDTGKYCCAPMFALEASDYFVRNNRDIL